VWPPEAGPRGSPVPEAAVWPPEAGPRGSPVPEAAVWPPEAGPRGSPVPEGYPGRTAAAWQTTPRGPAARAATRSPPA
jgi:hypothetical protein